MKEIRLIVRIKNNHLVTAREKMGLSQAAMAKHCGVKFFEYRSIENLNKYPLIQKNGSWTLAAQNISSAIGVSEEELFPEAFAEIQKSRTEVEIGLGDLPIYETLTQQKDFMEERELSETLDEILGTLNPRYKSIIECRFGLNGETPRTSNKLAVELGISGSRIRQIEETALRYLRHPKLITKLKSCYK